ncbi:hypothetical protein BC831DRAFT_231621 [Entophlyctis helioformis]|nr:hypothetical protein BC831DRAFT_231621 [Entophlyctis helioformis]
MSLGSLSALPFLPFFLPLPFFFLPPFGSLVSLVEDTEAGASSSLAVDTVGSLCATELMSAAVLLLPLPGCLYCGVCGPDEYRREFAVWPESAVAMSAPEAFQAARQAAARQSRLDTARRAMASAVAGTDRQAASAAFRSPELEHHIFASIFMPALAPLSYVGHYLKRTGDQLDGVGIFVKTSRFKVLQVETVEYRTAASLGQRDNGAIVTLLQCLHTSSKLVVATTHLTWSPKRGEQRKQPHIHFVTRRLIASNNQLWQSSKPVPD